MEDLHSLWPHRWVIPKAKLAESVINGLGLVAVEEIPKGEVVLIYGGVVVPRSDILRSRKLFGHCGVQIDENFFICPTSREEIEQSGTFNHSCDPDVGFKDQVEVIAMRDIKKGEELTLDYAFCESYFESFKCNCGSPNCREIIAQDDWKIKEIQENYGDYFSPYLKAKFTKFTK